MKLLNNNCNPIKYNLYYNIDLDNNIYRGSNNIELLIEKTTNKISFNSMNLKIHNINLKNSINNLINFLLYYDKENYIYTLYICDTLYNDKYYLNIEFSNKINNKGLIRFTNLLKHNTIYYTRCEPIYAQCIYPCFDELYYKVKYNLTIKINKLDYQILSNSNIIHKIIKDNYVTYIFKETIPMTTYVNSFIIGTFNYIEKISENNIRLRVYYPKYLENDNINNYTIECANNVLNFIIKYTNINFPYEKIDFVGIDNLDVGGCENYGLIYCNMSTFLFDILKYSLNNKLKITTLITHELIHMWFGNLLTIKNWNNIWLKEGFARFFEIYIIDILYPEFKIKSKFNFNLLKTLTLNNIVDRKTIDNINNIKDYENIYDSITYNKGAAILNIIYNFLGPIRFQNRIRKYLMSYNLNVDTSYFLDIFLEDIDFNNSISLRFMIHDYLNNIGIPILNTNKSNLSFNYSWKLNYHYIKNFFNNKIINDKFNGYYIINYNDIIPLIYELNNFTNLELMSITHDLYLLVKNNKFKTIYWVKFLKLLIIHITNDIKKSYKIKDLLFISNNIEYYLLKSIYKIIKDLYIYNVNIYLELINSFTILIETLNYIFDIFNISIYINADFDDIKYINYNKIILFLLKVNISELFKEKNNIMDIIYNIFNNEIFYKSYNLNKIVLKSIIKKYDVNTHIISIYNKFPYLKDLIDKLIYNILDKNIINSYINDIINKNYKFIDIINTYKFKDLKYLEININKQSKDYIKIIYNYFSNNEDFISKLLDIYLKDSNIFYKLFDYNYSLIEKVLINIISKQIDINIINNIYNIIQLNNNINYKKINIIKNINTNNIINLINLSKLSITE